MDQEKQKVKIYINCLKSFSIEMLKLAHEQSREKKPKT